MKEQELEFSIQQASTTGCDEPFPDIPSEQTPYRYFNQPIEQIPGWKEDVSQILFHGQNNGLYWQDIEDCVSVVECAKVSGTDSSNPDDAVIKIEERLIRPLQDLGKTPDPDKICQDIPIKNLDVVTCIKLQGNELVIQREKIFVLDLGAVDTTCENIPLIECSDETTTAASIRFNHETSQWEYN